MNLGELDSIISKDKFKPSDLDIIHYLFWDRGISLEEFNQLPIPYILAMVETHHWVREQEIKAQKKKR